MSTVVDGISYLGNAGASLGYYETSESGIDVDWYGMDTLQRTFDVRPDKIAEFLTAYKKDTQDSTFTWLYVTAPKISNVRGPMAKAIVTYKGVQEYAAGTKTYKEFIKGGVQKQQVTLEGAGGAQRTIEYRGPFTEWRYISTTRPDQPRHTGEMVQTQLNFTFIAASGSLGTVFINPTVLTPGQVAPAPDLTSSFNGLKLVQNSAFEFEQVGKVWTVLERNQASIVDYVNYYINLMLGTPGV